MSLSPAVRKQLALKVELSREAPDLSPRAADVLSDMYCAVALTGSEGPEPISLIPGVGVTLAHGAELHGFIRRNGFRRSLEVGFAYGFSTVWLLDAVAEHEGGRHVAVDPLQLSHWHGIGLHQIARLGPIADRFSFIEEPAVLALPPLIREAERFDFIFIDGNHRFDDVIVDFYLADQILAVGGVVAFDDIWMQSVRAAVDFISRNRSYELVADPLRYTVAFRKRAHDTRPWDHYRPFRTRFPIHRLAEYARRTSLYRKLRARK